MQQTTDLFERIRFDGQPAANPASVVTSGSARFTVLAPRLLRLEWSETGQFEDRATFAFPTRFSAVPAHYSTRQEGSTLVIDTGELVLRYTHSGQDSGKFMPHNLSITFTLNGKTVAWTPGTPCLANLRGTRRTVDECAGQFDRWHIPPEIATRRNGEREQFLGTVFAARCDNAGNPVA